MLAAAWAFMALTVAMAVFASPIKRYTDGAAAPLGDPKAYARAVIGADAETQPTTRPYDGQRAPVAPKKEQP